MATSSSRRKWLKDVNCKDNDPYKFMPDEKNVYCKICEKTVTVCKKSQLEQHHRSEKHKKNTLLREKRSASQAQLEEIVQIAPKVSRSNVIGKQLTIAALSANIPWNKFSHPKMRDFLESNIGFTIPDETTLRRVHLPDCFNDVTREIKRDLGDSSLWFGTDETTDSQGRYVVNVIAGKMDPTQYHSPYLVECSFVEKADAATVARLVMDTLRFINPNFHASQFKLFVSDAAPYMIRAGKDLKPFFPSMVHVTCVAHSVHRVCEMIRELFTEVNGLITTVKRVFLKAPSRVLKWKETHPNLALPPEPVLTRWGTWIEAALFYAKNYHQVKSILQILNADEALSIERAQQLIESASLEADLAFIAAHLSLLPTILTRLEESGLPLPKSLSVLEEAKTVIHDIPGERGEVLKQKFDSIIERNPGIKILRNIAARLEGDVCEMPSEFGPGEVALFKFCPITSVDVERSFSIYKNILSDNRQQLTKENIKKIIVTNCFYNR